MLRQRSSRISLTRIAQLCCVGAFTWVVPGCAVRDTWGKARKEGDLTAHEQSVPEKWSRGPKIPSKAATGWLADFGNGELTRLVDEAIAKNPDLKATAARVTQARAQVRIAGADLWPQAATDFNARRNQSASGQRFVGVGQRSNRFELGLDVSWEVDFWGRIKDQRGAAVADAEAAAEDLHAAKLSLAANVVKGAVTLVESKEQVRLAEDNVNSRRTHLQIVERQLERGLDSDRAALDVSLSRADLARAEESLALRKRASDEARRVLEVLLGAYPGGKETGLSALPTVKLKVPAGIPSEVLLRRPDIRAAERRLEASLREESAAKKAFLPSFNLTGGTGLSTEDLSFLIDQGSVVWTVAGNVAQQIFQGGRIKANVDLARARYEEALALYASTATTAFKEVESALSAEAYLLEQEAALERASTEAARSVQLATGQYERGLVDILTLLDAQQRAFDARSALAVIKAQRLRNRADLHLALGGDF
ncbi:NodT family efflux transporter outer membrane factor (OMF) lipoprotein [Roseimicrobium gellanilyticum]|uniref:NodT family efflux transporter outer membrane factor (OMF) lipoprotein n=1 Tax=Roseimicrobium gellanilyticum TaxID=748857 RepID=A0A366H9D3_9BACT|nr:efflux transporter outer membrane subunit [Roseimicrobium gellanilyticum]RBP37695.1 NodT family efflux transporter outer membrane factor (OMF) lipoprotein [Roseimicrobium gellanilyticum]